MVDGLSRRLVLFVLCRCGRVVCVICRGDSQARGVVIGTNHIKVITGGTGQHHRPCGLIHTLTPDKLTISIFLQQFDERLGFQRQGTGDRLLLVALRSARMVSKSSSSTTSGAGSWFRSIIGMVSTHRDG